MQRAAESRNLPLAANLASRHQLQNRKKRARQRAVYSAPNRSNDCCESGKVRGRERRAHGHGHSRTHQAAGCNAGSGPTPANVSVQACDLAGGARACAHEATRRVQAETADRLATFPILTIALQSRRTCHRVYSAWFKVRLAGVRVSAAARMLRASTAIGSSG